MARLWRRNRVPWAILLAFSLFLVSPKKTRCQDLTPLPPLLIEFNLFSGRSKPRAEFTETSQIDSLKQALSKCLQKTTYSFSQVPKISSTPEYTGAFITLSAGTQSERFYFLHDGWVSSSESNPAYRDSGSTLEKLAVSLAFTKDDMTAPGGPRPMAYLACAIPDSLHPAIACVSALANLNARSSPLSRTRSYLHLNTAFTLDGRRISRFSHDFRNSFPFTEVP